ncbi:unnamed protein product [Ixodes pacificus]
MGSVEHNEPFHHFNACIRSHQDYMKPCNVEYHINKVKAELHKNGADIDASCSANPGGSACWILDSLDPWNAILFQGGIGLYEDKLGSLACITFQLSHSEVYGNEGLMLESAYVFYRLFGSHCCLQRLVLSDAYPLLKEIYWPALLKLSLEAAKGLHSIDVASSLDREGRCSVLDAAPNVTSLREVACTIKPRIPDYLHETLRVNGCHLTSLKLGCAAVTAESLFTSLKFCSCLRLLELSSLEMDVAVFIDFMANNGTLTHLILSEVSSGTGNVEDGVASVLEKNTPLEVLELSMRGGDATHIADSLCTNSTLQFLSLENFGNLAIERFSRVLTVNETLIKLWLSAYFSYVDAGSLVEGILSNRTLKHLHISTKHAESILRLVEALRLNTTLCSLHVDDISTHEEEQRLVEMAALQPWALERLVTTWYGHCCRDLARTISIGANPTSLEVLYPMYQNVHRYDGLVELLTSLRSNESITFFSLTGYYPFGEIVSRHLGRLFACNKTLEVVQISTLCLEDYNDESHLQLLCEGLVRNSSIQGLQLVFIESKPDILKHLAVVVEENRHLTCLELDIEVLVDRDDDELLFVVAEWMQACTLFSNAIKTNKYLLKANLRVFASYSILEFASDYRLTVQHNLCALNRAARFVLAPAANKRAAEVFQDYERSPGLFRVLKETEKTRDLDVVRMIRSASTFIACHFFVVAGVVKERVQCEADGKTGLQLGDLDEVCMLKIVSYLKVCDVVS